MSAVLTALLPASAPLGAPSFTLQVKGTGFVAGDVILWNGGEEPTTFVNATTLTTGVNMSTAIVAIPIPIAVRSAGGVESNVLTFELLPEGTLPDVPVPSGWVLLRDPWARPLLVRVDEVAGIEERVSHTDPTGPLYPKSPPAPYRRLTLRGGAQFYISSPGSTALLTAL